MTAPLATPAAPRRLFPSELAAAINGCGAGRTELVDRLARHIAEDWARIGHVRAAIDARRAARLAIEGSPVLPA